jgi:hypothetical protein
MTWRCRHSTVTGASKGHAVFDLDVRDHNLWTKERMPVILLLYDVSRRRGYWLDVQAYFDGPSSPRPRTGAKTVRVRVPAGQTLTRRVIRRIRARKQEALDRFTLRAIP